MIRSALPSCWFALLCILVSLSPPYAFGQLTFKQLPGYQRYEEVSARRRELSGGGRVENVKWSDDGASLSYTLDGKRMKLDTSTLATSVSEDNPKVEEAPAPIARRRPPNGRAPVGRAKQRETATSPDEKWNAVYRNFNVWLESIDPASGEKTQVTLDGSDRLRFGTCCWVYGEELDQNDAMWWSPDSSLLAYYEVDERNMTDYHLTLDNTSTYTSLQSVRYPKPGNANPRVALWIYDVAAKEAKKIQIDGEPTQYLFAIRFSPNGKELLVNRTNRRQDVLDLLAIDVSSLKVRVVVSERQATWQNNAPKIQFLSDGERFLWETEANGWKHFQLRHLDGRLLNPISQVQEYACGAIEKVDEEQGFVYYTAFSDSNPYNAQLHRAKLDGTDHRRVTSSPLNHTSFNISPDNRFVLAVREQFDTPPCSVVYDEKGKEIAVIATGNTVESEKLKLEPPELFSFLSDDGKTTIYGTLHKPSHFDASKKYPLLVDVYGGPASQGISNRYQAANAICELGFIVVKIGNRGTVGRGKAFESATYLKLGGPDIADQADGVKYLRQRPYIDGGRVGIYGHSYGGYMSALALLKYPDVFLAGVAGAPVTDWKNYDTIYTERDMRTPEENPSGYREGSCVELAKNLTGKLLLVQGLIDDNVHPANTWQLSKALNDGDKRFEMMIYPEFQHGVGSTYASLRWELFHRHLNP